MPYNIHEQDRTHQNLKPVSDSRGITLKQKQREDFELERMFHRQIRGKKSKVYKYKKNGDYFSRQERMVFI